MTVASVASLGVFALLGQSRSASFAAVTIVWNAGLSRLVLKEPFTAVDALSTALVVIGSVIAVIFGSDGAGRQARNTLDMMVDDLRSDLAWQAGIVVLALVAVGVTFLHYREKRERELGIEPGQPASQPQSSAATNGAKQSPAGKGAAVEMQSAATGVAATAADDAKGAAVQAATPVKGSSGTGTGTSTSTSTSTSTTPTKALSNSNSATTTTTPVSKGSPLVGSTTAVTPAQAPAPSSSAASSPPVPLNLSPGPGAQQGGRSSGGGRDRSSSIGIGSDPYRMLECFVRAFLSGIFSGSTGMCSKLVIVTVVAAAQAQDYKAVLGRWEWYLALFGLPASLVFQLRFLNSALKRFDALEAVPIYQSSISLVGMAWGESQP